MANSEQDALVARLARYPVDRYPVQHATTQFHLGTLMLHAGDPGPATAALAMARDVFEHAGMRLEQAKSTLMLGVAFRTHGMHEEATAAFTKACSDLAALDQPAEQAAAAYNLGLSLQDVGDAPGAQAAWSSAQQLFEAAGMPSQAAAAARDHGAALLTAGDIEKALPLLQQASALAERAGDEAGLGAAANALGLAQLAAQNESDAISALRRSLGAFPRSVRPAEHAMVKANLAIAHERLGEPERARLAARQALAVPSAAPAVRAQAQDLLARLPGDAHEDLLTVLAGEDLDQWVPVLREEMLRVSELGQEQRLAVIGGLLDGMLARPGTSYELAQTLLGVVLELPPRTYELLVAAVSDACARRPEHETERLRAIIGSAMARFALPQWQRLAASLNAVAESSGMPATWR